MACGVTTTVNSITVTCDNAGTSAHAGNHSGLLTQSLTVLGRTYNWTSQRVYWKATAARPGRQKVATVGESDFA
jgi:hypothetical protein